MKVIEKGKLFGIPYNKVTISDLINFDKRGLNGLIGILTIFYLLLFVAALYNFFIHGHHAYNVTREHPWGILIATYAFFVISSIGMFLVATLSIIFDHEAYKPVSTRALVGAIALISAGFSVVIFEVGHPFRMILYQVVSPGFTVQYGGM
jgi:molybdopterin-containing oxidoreductase family membrane subunit